MAQLTADNLVSRKGSRLHRKEWKFGRAASGNPSCLIFLCHGFGEHLGWYEDLVAEFDDTDCYLFAHDHLGHGLSDGEQALVPEMQILVDDVIDNIQLTKNNYPHVPTFLIGHSMGGLISSLLAIQNSSLIDGMILISPLCRIPAEKASPLLRFSGKMLAWFLPDLQIPGSALPSSEISRDEKICQGYDKDPLVWHGGIKAQTGVSFMAACDELKASQGTLKVPFLLVHGTEDKLCEYEASQIFFDGVATEDKTLKTYEGMYHQVHHELEPESGDARQEMKKWILDRI